MWPISVEDEAVDLVGEGTTCFRASLAMIEVSWGLDVLSRSILKSPMSMSDLERDGGSSSREDSRVEITDESLDGGR